MLERGRFMIATFFALPKMYPVGYSKGSDVLEPIPRELLNYVTSEGRCPFEDWLLGIKDSFARAIVRKRLNRVRVGNLGNTKSLGGGVFELKIDFGPGYRVYFGEDGPRIVVLLIGGDKSSQARDIESAKAYWEDYQS
jgi:putative addiction module killer protein